MANDGCVFWDDGRHSGRIAGSPICRDQADGGGRGASVADRAYDAATGGVCGSPAGAFVDEVGWTPLVQLVSVADDVFAGTCEAARSNPVLPVCSYPSHGVCCGKLLPSGETDDSDRAQAGEI